MSVSSSPILSTTPSAHGALRRAVAIALRRSPLPLVAVSCSLALAGPAFSQDARTVEQVQAEVDRLKQLLQQEEQALAAKNAQASSPGSAAATPAQPAAQEDERLGKVTVRARNRLEPLQDVPLSISVVTGKELERLNAFDIDAITRRAGNVAWNQGNQRTSSLSIRGIGKQGQTEAQDPSVGIIVDGVNYAYNALTSSFDFTDIDTVEVSRGPQGTLLGKNASVGVINIVTRKPSFTPSADYGLTLGQWDTVQGRVAAGGPVVDGLVAWRGSLTVDKGRGDIVNVYNNDLTWQNKDRVSGRLQTLITPADNLSIRLAVDHTPRGGETTNGRTVNTPTPGLYSNGTANTSLTNEQRLSRRWFAQLGSYTPGSNYFYTDGTVNNDYQQPLVTGSNGALIDVSWQVGNFDVTSISAYKDYHFNAVNDEGTPFDVYRNAGGFWNDYKQISQELRLSSALGERLDYQTGLYFIRVDNSAEYRREWGNDAGAWFASGSPTAAAGTTQYSRLDADSAGRYLMQNSLDGLKMAFNSPAGLQSILNKSYAAFGQVNWHVANDLTVTLGARATREDRQNTASTYIKDNGFAPELNPDVVNGVDLGGFTSNASTGALDLVKNTAARLRIADTVANKYFGVAINPNAAPGAAYTSLTAAQQRQVADAKSIRRTAIGVVFPSRAAEPFKATQPAFVVSPSYKINQDLTSYVSWQYGEKAGIAQFVNGVSSPVEAEKTSAFEAGIKSTLLNNTLTFNVAAFFAKIKNYQQGVRIVDEYTTAQNVAANITPSIAYTSATGNVPRVEAKGLEIDGVYAGIRHTTIRFSGAYNDAKYDKFPNSAQPVENGFTGAPPYQDVSGQTLPGAYKYALNAGVDFRAPVFAGLEFITSFNAAYTSSYLSDNSLSIYSEIPSKTIVDLAVGLGRVNQSFSVTLLAKNLFNDDTPLTQSWSSFTPAFSRWFGVAVNGRL
ncbi:MAG: TonB-dependent receptor [Gammaproteobacteria bacterium]